MGTVRQLTQRRLYIEAKRSPVFCLAPESQVIVSTLFRYPSRELVSLYALYMSKI